MSNVASFINSKEFSKLIVKGKDQNVLTPEEINDAIPAHIVEPKDLDEIMYRIQEARIEVQDSVKDEDSDEGIRLDGTEIIEETLSKEEQAELRSASTDPVKLYLKRMGSVALLTREGEVEIAKEIEEGEREIVISCVSSTHALKEIIKLRDRIDSAQNQEEFVKELVRGLDDDSKPKEIQKMMNDILGVCDRIESILVATEDEDGTFKKFTTDQKKEMEQIATTLADLTFNRKIINSFVEPVKTFTHQFKELFDQQDRIYKFLEVNTEDEYRELYEKVIDDDAFKRRLAKDLFTTDSKIEQLIRNQEDILRKVSSPND